MLALSSCVPAPKQAYTPDQVESIDSLQEIMRVHAQHMDPLFSIREEPSFTQPQFDQMISAGAVMMETSVAMRDRFSGPFPESFATFSNDLRIQADEMKKAAEGGDARGARESIEAIRDVCRGCHSENR